MMNKKIIIMLAAIGMMLPSGAYGGAITVDETEHISAAGTIPFTPGPLLDDFSVGAGINLWHLRTGTFDKEGSSATCTPSYTAGSLRLDYNVLEAESYAGYFSNLGGIDLGPYTALSFDVKGEAGGEFFKVEFKNNSTTLADRHWFQINPTEGTHYYRNQSAVYITDYLDGGVTDDWRNVVIPFHNFANLDDWASMKELVIVFESDQSSANGSLRQGRIYIDNISFINTPIDAVRIDHYGDRIGASALGGNMGDMGGMGGSGEYSFSSTNYHETPYGLLSEYEVNPGWAGIFIIFGGGNDFNGTAEVGEKMGWIPIPHDFSDYTHLSFYARAKSASENPKIMKIELADDLDTKYYILTGITTDWQKFSIPLTSFVSGLRTSSIKQLNFVYEDWRIGLSGGYKIGGVIIDKIQFER